MKQIFGVNRWLVFAGMVLTLFFSDALCQESPADNRPLNLFNLRNLRFNFSGLSARPAAMGGAAIALSDDPAATTINPAGIGLFARPAISLSARFSENTFTEPSVNCDGSTINIEDKDKFLDQVLLSAVVTFKSFRFATFRENTFDARIAMTSARPLLITPGLSAAQIFRQNFSTRRTDLRMQVIDNGGSVAWRFSPKFNLGATVRLTRFEYHLSESRYFENDLSAASASTHTCIINNPETDNLYMLQSINEKQWGVGFSVGMLSRITKGLSIGLVYNNRPGFTMQNRIFLPQFTVQQADGNTTTFQQQDAITEVRFKLPDSYGIGFAFKHRGWLNFSIDLERMLYSQMIDADARIYGSLDPRNLIQDDNSATNTDPENEPDITLEDHLQFRTGMEYIAKFFGKRRRFPVRLGYYFEPPRLAFSQDLKPILSDAFPKQNGQHHFTAGLGMIMSDNLRIDGAVDVAPNSLIIMGSSVYFF